MNTDLNVDVAVGHLKTITETSTFLVSECNEALRRKKMIGRGILHSFKRHFQGVLSLVPVVFAAALLLAHTTPVNASQAWGSINNFDTVNDTGGECHGFEIEIDDMHSTAITYTYDYNHYGVPKITEDNTDPLHPKVFVRYQSAKNLDGTWAALTIVPTGPINPTMGHQFTNPSVNFGGEHFGVGYYGQPTSVKYNWLKDDGTGNLVHAGVVNISTPTFTYVPPAVAVPAQVQAVIVPPPPPAPPVMEFGPASWVKETKTSSHNNKVVELRDLVSDDPNDPNFKSWKNGEPDQVEVEWRIMQKSFVKPDGGPKVAVVGAPEGLPNGDEVITRRYDFYKYVGPLDAETGESMGDTVGPDGKHGIGIVTYADHFDPALGEWVLITVDMATKVVVGDYVGAQMAGFDAAGKIGLIDHLQDGEVNSKYTDRSVVVAGTAPILTTRTGSLPNGMSFDELSGIISGTPTVTGTFTFTVHSTDAVGGDITKTFNLTINDVGVNPLPHFEINTLAAPAAGGSTSGDGDYNSGTNVTVVATPNPGYAFLNWTDGGAVVSTTASYSYMVDVNRHLIANFIPAASVTVSTSSVPAVGGTTTGGGTYNTGDRITVTASANAGYGFVNWTKGAVIVSSSANYSFTASGNSTLTANFAASLLTTITMSTAKGMVGKSTTLIATLRNQKTKVVLAGKSVQFSLDGVNIGPPVITNVYGKATYKFMVPEETTIGLHVTTATFAGDTVFAPAVVSSTLGVTKGTVVLSITNVSGHAGSTVTLTAKLKNGSSVPMVGESITFSVGGMEYGSAVTDIYGIAKLSYIIPVGSALGYYALVAIFNEDADHFGVTRVGWLQVK